VRERPVRVLVVDDQALVREGLVRLLGDEEGIEVVGEARDGVEALSKIPEVRPDVALVDARMRRMDGVELIRHLSEKHPRVAAVVLTTFEDDEYLFGALEAGAKGHLLKDTPTDELLFAIKKAGRGEPVLGGPSASRVIDELRRSGRAKNRPGVPEGSLSPREIEVAALVGEGATNAEIARALYVSEGTARNQVSKVLKKLGLKDRTRLALHAVERGWTGGPPSGR
jgi:DNA-binding NarL/FixJ family response regulator